MGATYEPLSETRIYSLLAPATKSWVRELRVHQRIDSTNSHLVARAASGSVEVWSVLPNYRQRAGSPRSHVGHSRGNGHCTVGGKTTEPTDRGHFAAQSGRWRLRSRRDEVNRNRRYRVEMAQRSSVGWAQSGWDSHRARRSLQSADRRDRSGAECGSRSGRSTAFGDSRWRSARRSSGDFAEQAGCRADRQPPRGDSAFRDGGFSTSSRRMDADSLSPKSSGYWSLLTMQSRGSRSVSI